MSDDLKIVSLCNKEKKSIPNQDIVNFLEDLLLQAKDGSITKLAVVVSYFHGSEILSTFTGTVYDPIATLGGIERLRWKYQCWMDEIENGE